LFAGTFDSTAGLLVGKSKKFKVPI